MLWSDFVTAVNNQLSVEANRRGTETLRDQLMRNAVVDLQRMIPAFREGNITTYQVADMTVEGCAMFAALPAGALPKGFWIYSTATTDNPLCKRYRLDWYPWYRRADLVCGRLAWDLSWGCGPCQGGQQIPNPCPQPSPSDLNPLDWCHTRSYVYSMSPQGNSFLIYPKLTALSALMVLWNGYKIDFNGSDIVPYPEEMAEPVAEWVLWKIRLLVDKNPTLAQEHLQNYAVSRLRLYRDFRKTQFADGKGNEYDATVVAPPA